MEYKSIDELLEKAQLAEGRKFKEYDVNNRLLNYSNKGALGQIVEEGIFGYKINNRSEADFDNLGVELKVMPLKLLASNQVSAKERIVLTIIDYMEEYKKTFYESDCWKKSEKLLIMFYLWRQELEKGDYKIIKTVLHSFSEKDLLIIMQDWQVIINKIKEGRADELSEGDTMYLGACTKGANRNSVRKQPFSPILAKQRAYSLKSSYITGYARSILSPSQVVSIATESEIAKNSIQEILESKFKPYLGKRLDEISEILGTEVSIKNKSELARLTSLILNIKGTHLDDVEEFAKANIQFKTVRLEPNGIPKEHMSFEQINFSRLLDSEWEDSQFYEKFEYTKFLFVVFEYKDKAVKNISRPIYLKKICLWNMPEKIIQNEVKMMWESCRQVLQEGIKLIETKRGIKNNLPGAKDNMVCHIRPKASNGDDKVVLPDGQMITKQCYWLNREYIAEIVSNNLNI